jgi:hypothetical protein
MTGGNKGYSVHGKESKYIRWVFDNSSQITFYVDRKIPEAFIDGSNKIKYGWILESKHVLENLTEDIKLNYKKYFDVFALIFTHNKELLNLDERFKWVPANGFWIKDPKMYEKSKMNSFITSNKNFTPGHLGNLWATGV